MHADIKYKDWLQEWLLQKKSFVKEATLASYATAVTNHIIPVMGELWVADISEEHLQKTAEYWLTEGRSDGKGGLSERTLRGLVTIVKLSLKAAAKAGYMSQKQFEIHYPKAEQERKLQVFSKEQQWTLTQYVYLNLDARSLGVLFCLHTGLRIGELCALQWKDIDLEKRTVSVSRTIQRILVRHTDGSSETKIIITAPKSRTSVRLIPLSSGIYPVLRRLYTSNPEAYLLTGTARHTEPRTYREYYDRLLKKLSMEHINFHGLRHTFATRLIENGADYKTVSELLGHASVNLTLNLYVHPQMEQKRKAVELMNDFM